jgi:hypothetical protein
MAHPPGWFGEVLRRDLHGGATIPTLLGTADHAPLDVPFLFRTGDRIHGPLSRIDPETFIMDTGPGWIEASTHEALGDALSGLEDKVHAMDATLADMVAEMETRLRDLESARAGMAGRMDRLESSQGAPQDATQARQDGERMDELEGRLDALDAKLDELEGQDMETAIADGISEALAWGDHIEDALADIDMADYIDLSDLRITRC